MSDKTGTLTKNKMTLKEIISIKEGFNVKDKEKILRAVE
jgi:magnesium-transporting ATPase (P-type)